MMFANPHAHGGGGAPFLVEGITFPNADSGVVRGAGFTGQADSKLLSYYSWIRINTWADTRPMLTSTGGGCAAETVITPNGFWITADKFDSSAAQLRVRTTSALSTGVWYCLMGSFDMNDTAKRHLYIGDTNELSVIVYNNFLLDLTGADWGVALAPDLSDELDCEMGPQWYAPGQYIDLSVTDNRRKIFSAAGKPVDAGSDGSAVTGTAAMMYLRCLAGAAASTFGNNLGNGGAMSISAALGIASTSPSD